MHNIDLIDLTLGFIPVILTLGIMLRWSLSLKTSLLAIARMLIQLLLIGYALSYIFGMQSHWPVLLILCVMLLAASWISLSSQQLGNRQLFSYSLIAISISGIFTLLITTQGVLHATPWYSPQVIIPIAGMIFSNSMNAISLAAERFFSEFGRNDDYIASRNIAFHAALIPITNSLLAVGLVSLPGMMTGQILSGVSPLIAVRYQIMVMLMIFGSAGLSSAMFLYLIRRQLDTSTQTAASNQSPP